MERNKNRKAAIPIKNAIMQKSLPLFFLLTFLLSWSCWIIGSVHYAQLFLILGSFGPALSALLITFLVKGREGVFSIIKKLGDWRHGWHWYAFSLSITYLIIKISILLVALPEDRMALNADLPLQMIPLVFAYVFIFSVVGEEVGWRGFSLPLLLKNHKPLTASLILGFIWSIWHLPLFFLPGNFHQWVPFPWFLLQSIGLTILMTHLYKKTNGSLLMASLFHTASNVTIGLMPVLPTASDPDLTLLKASVVGLYSLLLILAWTERKKAISA